MQLFILFFCWTSLFKTQYNIILIYLVLKYFKVHIIVILISVLKIRTVYDFKVFYQLSTLHTIPYVIGNLHTT